ncbi:hypothetical protein BO82DRAFT_398133 [Aspergillus uvarum CBS 121591]|uniref:Uncharacterized protein n=1 Tax=Aspergillus uvarum CBS 121591 TaxID=1448315 RepID=A0A319E400_9EURO|nr:hypothetical protein BO82DRAFT_398133 [Aspergillus uvarum CBS 121591]PYH85812.1 hypothetical protein BO82DRAFT_398133 [Aspergillus uvarum CBS 121591]
MDGFARGQVQVYHPVNLHPGSWDEELVQRVRLDVETAGRREDRQKLEETELQLLLARNPAAKPLEFFEGLIGQTESEKTVRTAGVNRRLQEVEACNRNGSGSGLGTG